jgi:hypothetical protein
LNQFGATAVAIAAAATVSNLNLQILFTHLSAVANIKPVRKIIGWTFAFVG